MPGPEFWETSFGHRFLDGTCSRIADSLGQIADELKRANDLKEEELKLQGIKTGTIGFQGVQGKHSDNPQDPYDINRESQQERMGV